MTVQIHDTVANAMLDAWETAIGASPVLRLKTGAPPANPAAARTGTVVATINLPADWMVNAAARAKAMSGTWTDASADNAGTVGHYEIMNNAVTVCMEQGTVTATGGGGDMTIDNTVVAAGQAITITAFNRSMPNNA